MTRFELKKVFSRRINQIVLLVMAVVVVVNVYTGLKSVICSIYDESAEDGTRLLYGHAAAVYLRAGAEQYEGELTVELLRRVIEDNAHIHAMPEAQSESLVERGYAYTLTQGYRDIRSLCAFAYVPFDNYDYFALDNLEPEDADRFYSLRTQQLIDWLNSPENKDAFSDAQREFLINRYEALKTPLLYRPTHGWTAIFANAPMMLTLMCFVLAFLLSGVFADEARLKTDAIFYSSFHGRKKAVWAKVKAGLIITNGVYWGCMLVFSAALLLALGAQGWDCPVQITANGWKSIYNITILQKFLITLVCGWVGISAISMLSMLISAKTNSATLAMAVPALIILFPQIIVGSGVSYRTATYMMGLMTQQLLQVNEFMSYFVLYPIGGKILTKLDISPWLHLALSALLVPLVYNVYRKKNPA